MKQKIIIALCIIAGFLYLGVHYVIYGSLTRNCVYTENKLPVPEQLAEGKIVVARDAYIAIGHDKEYGCLKNFGNVDREIIGPETINDITIGRKYFTNRGLTVELLKKGTSFRVVDVIAVTKHGISTIDSGSGPIYYLVLKDQNDLLYQIATVSLGSNKGDQFLALEDSSQVDNTLLVKLLSTSSFDTTADYEGENSLKYTGKLFELPTSYLESIKPQWEKLADRLEKGGNFFIQIAIELRDNGFREIKLSENPEERYKQVTQIQEEFIKKIPANIELKNVEKDKSWPYISMEANLDLLNYLVDNQVELKIKSISELTK